MIYPHNIEEYIAHIAKMLQQEINREILMSVSNPKLVFRTTANPLILEYGMVMDHGHGSFTPTGMQDYHVEPVAKWCNDNRCGIVYTYPHQIVFSTEGELAWFMLAWS